MLVRTYSVIAGLALAVVAGACGGAGHTQEVDFREGESADALASPAPVLSSRPSQQALTQEIRTIPTGVKSPAQQEALLQASTLAPGAMNAALREALVDAAAFVSDLALDRPGDLRLDSLAHLLIRALQPHFSQEELAADILSIARTWEEERRLEPVRRARQKTSAWLAMHLSAGDMGDDLRRAVIKGEEMLFNGDWYSMSVAGAFLSNALFKQYGGYSEADFAAEIARGIPADEVAYIRRRVESTRQWKAAAESSDAPFREEDYSRPEIAELSQEKLIARIRAIAEGEEGERQFAAIQQIRRMEAGQIGDSLRAVLTEVFLYKYEETMQRKEKYQNFYYGDIMYPLEEAIGQLQDPGFIEFIVRMGRYGVCGEDPPRWILQQFPDTTVALLVEAMTRPTTPSWEMENALELLSELVVSWKTGRSSFGYREGAFALSEESRALLLDAARSLLEGDVSFFDMGVDLAVTLDDPDLIDILKIFATDQAKLTALGFSAEQAASEQEDIKRALLWRPHMGIQDC